jgi:hypothetical protein
MRFHNLAAAAGLSLALGATSFAFALTATAPAATPANAAAPAASAPAAKAPTARARTHRRSARTSTLAKQAPVVEPEAVQALQRMGAYLSTLTSFEVTTQTSLDLVLTDDQRVTLDGGARYKVRRPDAFVIDVTSDAKSREYIYDGKQFTIYAPALGLYATASAPPTIGATLDAIWQRFGISLPLQDLFRWSDPNNRRAESLQSALAVGPATLDGVRADHYLFREGDIDWQIWIQQGDQPLPLKLVIVDRSDPADPAYVARLKWNVSPTLTADDFAFRPDANAKRIPLAMAGR